MSKRMLEKIISTSEKEKSNMSVSFRLPEKMKKQLDYVSKKTGKKKSEIVKDVMSDVLDEAANKLWEQSNKNSNESPPWNQ